MKLIYFIRNGVSLDEISHLVNFINEYKGGGIFKAIFYDKSELQPIEITRLKQLMKKCAFAFLFLGSGPVNNLLLKKEIILAYRLWLKRGVFTLDEEKYPSGWGTNGIPRLWRHFNQSYLIYKANGSNLIREIMGPRKFGGRKKLF